MTQPFIGNEGNVYLSLFSTGESLAVGDVHVMTDGQRTWYEAEPYAQYDRIHDSEGVQRFQDAWGAAVAIANLPVTESMVMSFSAA